MQQIQLGILLLFTTFTFRTQAQIDESQLGGWYMYFWNTEFKESGFGMQGDYQYRNWNVAGDLEQLLLRTGFTYQPKGTPIKFTQGYAFIQNSTFGANDLTAHEHRIYQEALLKQSISERFYLTHRFRFEQRFVEEQDFRTRYRYNLFVNVPFNKKKLEKNTIYLALYNEIFINGQRNVGGHEVEIFDRNRTYAALGYGITDNIRVQAGWMLQTTDNWSKHQLQFSFHHKI